jgi:hypothetical protein
MVRACGITARGIRDDSFHRKETCSQEARGGEEEAHRNEKAGFEKEVEWWRQS